MHMFDMNKHGSWWRAEFIGCSKGSVLIGSHEEQQHFVTAQWAGWVGTYKWGSADLCSSVCLSSSYAGLDKRRAELSTVLNPQLLKVKSLFVTLWCFLWCEKENRTNNNNLIKKKKSMNFMNVNFICPFSGKIHFYLLYPKSCKLLIMFLFFIYFSHSLAPPQTVCVGYLTFLSFWGGASQ